MKRTYYGYRPRSMAEICHLELEDIQRQEIAYCEWLAKVRSWSFQTAEEYARAFAPCAILSVEGEPRKSDVLKEIRISARVAVRIVKAWSRTCKLHYAPRSGKWQAPGGRRGGGGINETWFKSDAPTLYRVIADGREGQSYLTQGRALAKSETLAATSHYAPDAMEAWS